MFDVDMLEIINKSLDIFQCRGESSESMQEL